MKLNCNLKISCNLKLNYNTFELELDKFEIVSPAKFEAVLLSHPSVRDAIVIGIENELNGEIPKAFVILKKLQ